jgi:hypothetical protein
MGTGVLSRGKASMKLSTHLYLVLRLRISGVIPIFLLYAFMAWTGKLY